MHNLENIRVREFLALEDEYKFKDYLDLKSIMNGKADIKKGKYKSLNLMEVSFGEVAKIKRYLADPTPESVFECFRIIYGLTLAQYNNLEVVDYFYGLNHIEESVLKLMANEKAALSREEDPILEMAGGERLQVFGELPTLIDIGQRFGKTLEEVEAWKYGTIFSILAYDKVSHEVGTKYNKLKAEINGPKK